MNNKLDDFDPNGIGETNGNIFGLPFTYEEATLVILPVPWEVTVSYRAGTAKAPEAILDASLQVDLYDPFIPDAWKLGIALKNMSHDVKKESDSLRGKAEEYISQLSSDARHSELTKHNNVRDEINQACSEMNRRVKDEAITLLNQNKLVALLGGDHSIPLGLMQALAEKHSSFGVLHFDAHADLREAYEGFQYSHASIMFNVLHIPQISRLVQIGIRDYCEAERELIQSNDRISTFFDRDIKHQLYEGKSWKSICDDIIRLLPDQVYISFDIDGLDPKLCPNTGTPVPGGLELGQTLYLMEKVVESGRKIIGFDLNEVAPGKDEWDANVGARLLYRLSNLCIVSNR